MKKIVLAIETTDTHLGLALLELTQSNGNTPPVVHFSPAHQRQSDLLIPELEGLMKKAEASKENIGLVAVDIGPGSFTGVRVGVSAARTLAQSLKVPLVGISSLEAMARSYSQASSAPLILPILPALSGELYFAAYNKKVFKNQAYLQLCKAPCWKKLMDFADYLGSIKNPTQTHIITALWKEEFESLRERHPQFVWFSKPVPPHPLAIAEIAKERWDSMPHRSQPTYDQVGPLYLQPSWAERKKF